MIDIPYITGTRWYLNTGLLFYYTNSPTGSDQPTGSGPCVLTRQKTHNFPFNGARNYSLT